MRRAARGRDVRPRQQSAYRILCVRRAISAVLTSRVAGGVALAISQTSQEIKKTNCAAGLGSTSNKYGTVGK